MIMITRIGTFVVKAVAALAIAFMLIQIVSRACRPTCPTGSTSPSIWHCMSWIAMTSRTRIAWRMSPG